MLGVTSDKIKLGVLNGDSVRPPRVLCFPVDDFS